MAKCKPNEGHMRQTIMEKAKTDIVRTMQQN